MIHSKFNLNFKSHLAIVLVVAATVLLLSSTSASAHEHLHLTSMDPKSAHVRTTTMKRVLDGDNADNGDDFYSEQFDDDYKQDVANENDNNNNNGNSNNDNGNDNNNGNDNSNNNNDNERINDDYYYKDGTIDFTKYSIKFHTCSSLVSFETEEGKIVTNNNNNNNNNNNYEDMSIYNNEQVVSYRLCPVDKCQDDSWDGCKNSYGNYMIPLEEYVNIHQDHIQDTVDQFCDYCKQCDYLLYQFNFQCDYYTDCTSSNFNYTSLCYDDDQVVTDYTQYLECTEVDLIDNNYGYGDNNGNGDGNNGVYYDDAANADDGNAGDDANGDDANANADDGNNNNGDDQIYYEQEAAYQSGYNNRQRQLIHLYQQKQQQQQQHRRRSEENNNNKAYVKVYCDGTIKLGLFSDDQCTNYIGDSTSVYQATGLAGIENDLNEGITHSNCVSCTKEKSKYFLEDQDKYSKNQSGYYEDGEGQSDELFDICEQLYDDSAQCNTNLNEDKFKEDSDADTCDLIEAFQKGSIDQYGHILTKKMKGVYWAALLIALPACVASLLLLVYIIRKPSTIDNEDLDTNLVHVRFSDDEPVVFT